MSSLKRKRPSPSSAWVTASAPGEAQARQAQAPASELQEIVRGAEDQRAVLHVNGQRHADAAADILLEAGRPGEALRRMHDVREAAPARVKPRPVLAARRDVLRHGHDARHAGVARDRERSADQPRRLREPPAGAAHLRLDHLADIDGGLAAGEALGEAAADRRAAAPPSRLPPSARGTADRRVPARSRGSESGTLNAATCERMRCSSTCT